MFWLEVPERIFARSFVRDDTEGKIPREAIRRGARPELRGGRHFLEWEVRPGRSIRTRLHASPPDAERLYWVGVSRSFARAFGRLAFRTAQRTLAERRAASACRPVASCQLRVARRLGRRAKRTAARPLLQGVMPPVTECPA